MLVFDPESPMLAKQKALLPQIKKIKDLRFCFEYVVLFFLLELELRSLLRPTAVFMGRTPHRRKCFKALPTTC